ncbi:MAG: ndh [Chlamydiales bacterium]|jgi:NADH dehydrogenase|nr:ndh [Chlamydiales bacterium]
MKDVNAKRKIVILGGGFGGLYAIQALKSTDVDLILIDKVNYHLFQPLLYQVATAALAPRDIAIPFRKILKKQKNLSVILGEVTRVDKEQKVVYLNSGETINYDALVIAIGVAPSYYGRQEWREHARAIKTIPDALSLRDKILMSLEKAHQTSDVSKRQAYLNFIVIGGGPTGVEMAGAVAELVHFSIKNYFNTIDPLSCTPRVILLEAAPRILGAFPEYLSLEGQKSLNSLKVQVITNAHVNEITEGGVLVNDHFIPSKNVIWSAGNTGTSLVQSLNTPLDQMNRVIVNPDLTIPHCPDLFVIGDAAHCKDKKGIPLPGVAPVAIQQGKYIGSILKKDYSSGQRPAFEYFDKGAMAMIGKGKAIARVGKLQISGFLAWLAWSFIHIFYLIGFHNRIFVLLEWLWWICTGARGNYLIYKEEEMKENLSKSEVKIPLENVKL